MRIKVNINEPSESKNVAELQPWIESHADNVEDYFVVAAPHRECFIFHFVYTTVLGCHRLFIYDPINEILVDFFAEDFTDIGRWIFKRCDDYFGCDYEILM